MSNSAPLWTAAHQAPPAWDSPDKNTRVGCHALLQGIFQIQGSNQHLLCLLHWQVRSFTTSTTWEAPLYAYVALNYICCCSVAQSWTAACQASLSITNSWSLLKLMSIESVRPSNHLIFCHPLLFLPSNFPASGSFLMGQLFTPGGQSTRVSASASVLPMNIQDWFPLGLTGWISLQSKGLSRVFFNTTVQKHQFISAQPSLWPNSHIHIWLWKNHRFD